MCPQCLAQTLLELYGRQSLPVNVTEIAEKIGLQIVETDKASGLHGFFDKRNTFVLVDRTLPLPQRNVAIAEAIWRSRTNWWDRLIGYEKKCYTFVGSLLVPAEQLLVLSRYCKMALATLCYRFMVPESLMRSRLVEIDLTN